MVKVGEIKANICTSQQHTSSSTIIFACLSIRAHIHISNYVHLLVHVLISAVSASKSQLIERERVLPVRKFHFLTAVIYA